MLVTLNILDEGTSPAPPIDTTIPLNAQWVASRSGANLPGDAIAGGREGARDLYVCRARFNGSIFPGKTWGQGCYFGLGGAEWFADEYDVLTGSADENLWSRDSNGAFTGGSDAGTPAWPVCRGELVRDR